MTQAINEMNNVSSWFFKFLQCFRVFSCRLNLEKTLTNTFFANLLSKLIWRIQVKPIRTRLKPTKLLFCSKSSQDALWSLNFFNSLERLWRKLCLTDLRTFWRNYRRGLRYLSIFRYWSHWQFMTSVLMVMRTMVSNAKILTKIIV